MAKNTDNTCLKQNIQLRSSRFNTLNQKSAEINHMKKPEMGCDQATGLMEQRIPLDSITASGNPPLIMLALNFNYQGACWCTICVLKANTMKSLIFRGIVLFRAGTQYSQLLKLYSLSLSPSLPISTEDENACMVIISHGLLSSTWPCHYIRVKCSFLINL